MLPDQLQITQLLREPTQTNINESAQYTAQTARVSINTANSNLDGTGTITTVLTAASSGTRITTVYIQAITDTSEGMIRFYMFNGATYYLIDEVRVPATKKSGTQDAWAVAYELQYNLIAGYSLTVSTEIADTFIITVEGLDWTYAY